MNRAMKYLKLLLIILLPFLFFSCNRDRGIIFNNNNAQTYGIIDATLNGYTWSANSGAAAYNNFSLNLYGSAPDGSSLEITIYPYNGLGSYTANSPASIRFYDAQGYQYDATSGTVNITSDAGDLVQGNFSFTAFSSSMTIDMSGSFNLYYQ